MKYRKGYKYQLAEDLLTQTDIIPDEPIYTQFIDLTATGLLIQRSGYAWDGCSGPTFDTDNSMIPGCVHDGFFQLKRMGYLKNIPRKIIDDLFFKLCLDNGMWKIRAKIWYKFVRRFAGYAADPKNIKKVYEV